MLRRLPIFLVCLASASQAQTSTNCQLMGQFVNCQSTTPPPAPALNGLYHQLLNGGNSFQQGQAQAQQRQLLQQQIEAQRLANEQAAAQMASTPSDAPTSTPEQRRADAYAQVGKLIAAGQCKQAKQLAHFYNHDDIIRDTDLACTDASQ